MRTLTIQPFLHSLKGQERKSAATFGFASRSHLLRCIKIPKVSLKQSVHGREPSRIPAELPSISGLADSVSDSDSDSNSESDSNSDSDSWFDSDSDSDSDADSDSDSDNQDCQEYTLLNINIDGYVWLRGRNGRSKNDLSLPYGNDNSEELAEQIRQDFNAGKDLVVTVTKFMGQEMIISYESFDRVIADDLDYHC